MHGSLKSPSQPGSCSQLVPVVDESFISGIPVKDLSLQTGNLVSAAYERQDVANSPFRPS
jgi:hypothetical protein